jgi:hypothetical protein
MIWSGAAGLQPTAVKPERRIDFEAPSVMASSLSAGVSLSTLHPELLLSTRLPEIQVVNFPTLP